tara:strand:- start:316 stop:573 length:258 start_codon:yes stop_codon:yes gene_type:complete
MVKKDDMVKLLVEEILDLNNKLLFASQDSMDKLERIQTRLFNNNTNNENMIKFVKDNDKEIKNIRHKLNGFNKIFEIILEQEEKS